MWIDGVEVEQPPNRIKIEILNNDLTSGRVVWEPYKDIERRVSGIIAATHEDIVSRLRPKLKNALAPHQD